MMLVFMTACLTESTPNNAHLSPNHTGGDPLQPSAGYLTGKTVYYLFESPPFRVMCKVDIVLYPSAEYATSLRNLTVIGIGEDIPILPLEKLSSTNWKVIGDIRLCVSPLRHGIQAMNPFTVLAALAGDIILALQSEGSDNEHLSLTGDEVMAMLLNKQGVLDFHKTSWLEAEEMLFCSHFNRACV